MRSSTDKLKSTTNICIQYKRSSRQFKKGVPARENGQYCSNFRQFLRNFYKFSKKKRWFRPQEPPWTRQWNTHIHISLKKKKKTKKKKKKKKKKKRQIHVHCTYHVYWTEIGSLPFNFTSSTFFLPIQFTLLKS